MNFNFLLFQSDFVYFSVPVLRTLKTCFLNENLTLLPRGFQFSFLLVCSKYKTKFDFPSENVDHRSIHSGPTISE